MTRGRRALIGGLLLGLVLSCLPKIAFSSEAQREATYERVMRTRTIRCGYQVWPPAFSKDPNSGKLSGINYDFMSEIGRELGLKIEWVAEVGSGDAVEALNTGKFDVMCTSMWPDPGRLSQAEYTMPTYYSALYPYVRTADVRFDNHLNAINNHAVRTAGIEGDVTLEVAQKAFPEAEHVALPQSADGSQLILSLATKKADVIFIDAPLADNYLKSNPGIIRRIADVGAIRIFGEHLLLPNGEFKFLNVMNTTILTLINSGSMDRILNRYEGTFIAPAKSYSPVPAGSASARR